MEQNKNLLKWLRLGLLVAYWAVIFAGTHVPGRYVSGDFVSDKLLHFAAFAGLAFLLAWVLAPLRPTRTALLATLLAAGLYAGFDETTQMLVPRRTADVRDWYADMGGILVGLLAYLVSWTLASGLCGGLLRDASAATPSREIP